MATTDPNTASAPTQSFPVLTANSVDDLLVRKPTLSRPLPAIIVSTAEKNARTQEFVRAGITFSFLLILVLIIIWGCAESRSWPEHWQQTKELLQIILPALTGLLGSSLGFYFGRSTVPTDSSSSQTTPP